MYRDNNLKRNMTFDLFDLSIAPGKVADSFEHFTCPLEMAEKAAILL